MKERTSYITNRRAVSFHQSKVTDILPDYFKSDYPLLISFLERYYDFIEQNDPDSFATKIQELYFVRDMERAELQYIENIFYEIGGGVSADFFPNPRYIGRLLASFYRVKGSTYSAEGFFRAFYGGEEIEIVYPKNNIFIVGESRIGAESLKYIINDTLYQVFSILIKSSIPISTWRELYKKYVHPAGFYLAGEVVIEAEGNLFLNLSGETYVDANFQPLDIKITSEGTLTPSGTTGITAIFPDSLLDSDVYKERVSIINTIEDVQALTVSEWDALYNTTEEAISANSPTFDDDSAAGNKAIKFSNTIETMDEDIFDQDRPAVYKDSG